MNPKVFENMYLTHEQSLRNVLKSQRIYDEDIFQDTCLALCEFALHNEITDFWTQFMKKYNKLYKRIGQREVECVHFDNAQFAALDIIDESQTEEKLDANVDWNYDHLSAQYKELLQQLLDQYIAQPMPKEHKHKRACRILQLYLDGKSEREIARKFRITHQAVHQNLERIVEHLKLLAGDCIIEGITFA